ncbi:MAG: sporulation protein YunB [Clostridia bacterium]|nr:sporulation protein YunB [Clostridia bacterium]MBQ5545562.1 sporulation protein YunB [Clostridia bacterium]
MRYQRHRWNPHALRRRIFLGTVSFFLIFAAINISVRPLLKRMTAVQAAYITNLAINEAAQEVLAREDIFYDRFVSLHRLDNGTISSMTTDIREMNKFKTALCREIQSKLGEHCDREVSVPLGTLTDIDLLSGRGPRIRMKIELYGSVNAELKSSFEDAGINQTRHRIICNVKVGVSAIIPGCSSYTEVENSFTVSETVLLGEVPDSFTQVNTTEDLYDDINNYIDN